MRSNHSAILFASFVAAGLLLTGCGPSSDGGGDSSSGSDADSGSDSSAPLNVTVEWGNLKGRFVYDGKPPAQSPVNMAGNANADYCGQFNPQNEALVVNAANGGIRDVIVFLHDETEKVHPDYEKSAEAVVRFDNEYCRFAPHVCLLRTSQTLGIGNKDTVGHNTKIDPFHTDNKPFNQVITADTVDAEDLVKVSFPNEETRPIPVGCSIHTWMNAYLLIRANPYFAVSDEDGNFEIENLPGGRWSMEVWHPTAGYVQKVSIGGKNATWKRGRVDAIIDDGDDDWGEVKLAPDIFQP